MMSGPSRGSAGKDVVSSYHRETKHNWNAYARGPGFLDWETQPDPFRRYRGAPVIHLERDDESEGPDYEHVMGGRRVDPAPLAAHSLGRFFYDSLALSAWKEAGGQRWSLRVNPSSGNLHPTECYLITGPIAGIADEAVVCHYAPKEHALERRAVLPGNLWRALARGLPEGSFFVGLTSVHWREAWKYGERAFRYCNHDAGHAIAAVTIAAAGLGWRTKLIDEPGTGQLEQLLGLSVEAVDAEPEQPDCLLLVTPGETDIPDVFPPDDAMAAVRDLAWEGTANRLSPGHTDWPVIEQVASAAVKPPTRREARADTRPAAAPVTERSRASKLREIIRGRRSAVAMDPDFVLNADDFLLMLRRTVPALSPVPFDALPWDPAAHLALFVHRVDGFEPGLYLLVRDASAFDSLRGVLRPEFRWERSGRCPGDLDLFLLAPVDLGQAAKHLSCHQDIAGTGCFSLGMVTEFDRPLEQYGPWFYPRLFWECGVIGQVLYLEAEACGIRGTGIGCYFDDPVHELLGIEGTAYQSLYHFTVGKPVEDPRITTLPAYP